MDSRPRPTSALVIGDGVVGLACAIELQRRGISTVLIGPEDLNAASWGNAGHLAVEQVEPLASPALLRSIGRRLFIRGGALSLPPRDIAAWLPFGLRLIRASRPERFAGGIAALRGPLADAIPAWRRLAERAGAPELIREDGHLVVWESPDTAARGRARWAAADIGCARIRDVTPAERETLARLVRTPIAGAIRFLGSGQVSDLEALRRALLGHFSAIGGVRQVGRVRLLQADGAGAQALLFDGSALRAEVAVVAAGVASASLLQPLGLRVPMIAERGYHIQAGADGWPTDLPPVVFEDRSMIVTRFASALRAASFVEFGRAGAPADARKWARLRHHVSALGLPFQEPVKQWMGARPTLPDYLPAIGRDARRPALCYAFGHQHLGLTLAATTGEAIAAMLLGESGRYDLAPFGLGRFDPASAVSNSSPCERGSGHVQDEHRLTSMAAS